MIPPVKTLVAIDAGANRDAVEAVIPVQQSIELVAIVDGLDAGWHTLTQQPVDAVVIACASESDYVMSFIDGVAREYPDRPVILMAGEYGERVREQGVRVGCRGRDHGGASRTASRRRRRERERVSAELVEGAREGRWLGATGLSVAPRSAQGRMITVLGPKGGAGKTLVSCNLAVALGEAGQRVVLVDLDLQFGDVGLALGLPPGKTIYDLVMSGGALDAEKLSAYLATHESGARVLLGARRGRITREL